MSTVMSRRTIRVLNFLCFLQLRHICAGEGISGTPVIIKLPPKTSSQEEREYFSLSPIVLLRNLFVDYETKRKHGKNNMNRSSNSKGVTQVSQPDLHCKHNFHLYFFYSQSNIVTQVIKHKRENFRVIVKK